MYGNERNSYSKTDHDATFMHMKKDYMGNDQLLPSYNIQFGVCNEYIAVYDSSMLRIWIVSFLLWKNFIDYTEGILNIQLPTQAMEASTTICTVKNME